MDRPSSRTGKAPARRGLAFWAPREGTPAPAGWSGLPLGLVLGVAFLAACAGRALREITILLPNDRVTQFLGMSELLEGALARHLLAFGAAALLCHLLLGAAAFFLARLTEAAFPGRVLPRRGWLVAGWFALLVALVIAANATWHPASLFADENGWLLGKPAGVLPVTIALTAFAACVLTLAARAAWHRRELRTHARPVAVATTLAVLAAVALPRVGAGRPAAGVSPDLPHVVIIGVDSLRTDLIGAGGNEPLTPHLDRFLGGAYRFDDTTSPLARTYGSWVSILTGRHPVSTGARVNLMPRRLVREGDTLADALRGHGYRSTFATDEARFANIDGSFGFDQVVTPPMGAADFVLGHAGDQPLVNLVAASGLGAWLFPWIHANRAAHVTYRPSDFVARLDRSLAIEGPAFIAIHLTLAHWPYSWSGMATPRTPQEYRPAYRRAIEAVDRQFEDVLEVLASKGVLDNALVVLLSDHGEALGGPTDSMLRGTGTSREIWDSLWGHGTSVMSPHQYQVLFGLRAFGRARIPGRPGMRGWPASLEDIRPTLEELVTAAQPSGVDGVSLLPFLAGQDDPRELHNRVRFTETDFNTPSTVAGRLDASAIADEASDFYQLEPDSGWVQFRPDRIAQLLARKQRAALSPDALLAAVPGPTPGTVRYLFTNRIDPRPAVLEGPPEAWTDVEARRLWEALAARFPGELPAALNLDRM